MAKLSKWFFATAAIFALCGMIWGIQMSASHDNTLSPAHGHLNLIGFVAMSIFGTYYSLTPKAAVSRLAILHFWLTTLTVLILVPGIALAILGQSDAFARIGSVLAVLSMALFVGVILRHGVGETDSHPIRGHQPQSRPIA